MRGHDVHVFTTSVDGNGDSDVPLGRPVDLDGVKVTYFPSRHLRRLYWSPEMRRALARTVPTFDLVHLHAIYLWPMWAGARVARRARVPYVSSPRGMLAPELVRRKSRLIKNAWLALIERRNLERSAALHATSSGEAADIRRLGWSLPPVSVIPHGVDDPEAVVEKMLSDDVAVATAQGGYVLSFGRINWEKGLDRLIGALPLSPAVRVVIAGDDCEGHAASLSDQARRLGVSDRVTLLARHVGGTDKERLFDRAACFAMPSLAENFGLAAFEAMRRGLSVLVTQEVGMSEIVRKADAGIVVEGSAEAVAGGLTTLLADPEKRKAMGNAGRAHVVAHYGWPAIAQEMEVFYRSVLTAGGRRVSSR